MVRLFRKNITLTLQEMMNIQHRFNNLRLESEELRIALKEAHMLIEVLKKREPDSVKTISSSIQHAGSPFWQNGCANKQKTTKSSSIYTAI